MYFNRLLIVILLLTAAPIILPQEDSTKTNEDWEWHWDRWEDWTVDFGFKKTRPAMSLQYGLANLNREGLQSKFVDPNLLEVKLGYVKDRVAWETDNIIRHKYNYLYLSNESNKLAGKEADGSEVESEMWRFGFGRLSGYGYKLGESAAVIPYYSYTMNWSNIDFGHAEFVNPEDEILDLYDKSFRFGTSSEGGVRIKIIDNLLIDAGYERSIVFQRHLFWKWAGGAVMEAAAQALVDGFISEVFESSPVAGPIVNFLLKNALAYGIYELRQDKMNWPFNSEAPIAYDQFKFGVTVVF